MFLILVGNVIYSFVARMNNEETKPYLCHFVGSPLAAELVLKSNHSTFILQMYCFMYAHRLGCLHALL